MSGAETRDFSEACRDVSRGNAKVPRSALREVGRFPVVDQGEADIAGYTDDERKLFNGTLPVVLFGDHTRRFKFVNFPFAMGADGVKVLMPADDVDPRYLYWCLCSIEIPSAGYSRHFKFLKNRKIPVPPLAEQRRIARVLDAADALRVRRRRGLEALASCEVAAFWSLFGDPVTNSRGFDLAAVASVGDLQLGRMLDKKREVGTSAEPYLRNANVRWFDFDLSELYEMDFDPPSRKRYRLRSGDVLVCEGGEVGRCAVWDAPIEECYFQKALHRVRFSTGAVEPTYFARLMWVFASRGAFSKQLSQATFAHLTKARLGALEIPIPPADLQVEFRLVVERTARIRALMRAHYTALDELFRSLQVRAFAA